MSIVWDILKGLFTGLLEALFNKAPAPPVATLKEVQDAQSAGDARDHAMLAGVLNPEQYAREPDPNSRD